MDSREELLIELVREHPVLFDPAEKRYQDNNFKALLWKKIADECGLASGDSAKELWKKLRDGFRSCKKRKRNAPEASSKILWRFETQMSFLTPFMKDRMRPGITEDAKGENSLDDVYENQSEETTESMASNTSSSILSRKNASSASTSVDNTDMLNFLQIKALDKGECTNKRDQKQQNLLDSTDPLKCFFDSMYVTTKTFPPDLQRKVKKELFAIVSRAEDDAEVRVISTIKNEFSDQ